MVAGILVALEPLHLALIGQPFSHAYTGGIRHAVTVGFISQMIVGVGLHVAHRQASIPDRAQPALWSTFILLNLGNFWRVAFEVATDYTPGAFLPMGFTGFVELTGLAIWAWAMGKALLAARANKALASA
jgi:hypothetical protein